MKLLRFAPRMFEPDEGGSGELRQMRRACAIADAVESLRELGDDELVTVVGLLRSGGLPVPAAAQERQDDLPEFTVGEGEQAANLSHLRVLSVDGD